MADGAKIRIFVNVLGQFVAFKFKTTGCDYIMIGLTFHIIPECFSLCFPDVAVEWPEPGLGRVEGYFMNVFLISYVLTEL
jgi:hypothetical protein